MVKTHLQERQASGHGGKKVHKEESLNGAPLLIRFLGLEPGNRGLGRAVIDRNYASSGRYQIGKFEGQELVTA